MKRTWLVLLAFFSACGTFALPARAVTVYLTTADRATLGGLTFHSGDVVAYNTIMDVSTLYFSQTQFRKSNRSAGDIRNIDAIHVVDDNTFLLSASDDARLLGPGRCPRPFRFPISRSWAFGPPGEHENARSYTRRGFSLPSFFRSSNPDRRGAAVRNRKEVSHA